MSEETRPPILWRNGLGQRRWQPRMADGRQGWKGDLVGVPAWSTDDQNGRRHPYLCRFRWWAVFKAAAAQRYEARLAWLPNTEEQP